MLTDIGPNVFNVLYRSVSPWEMVDILETHEIRGRGGAFAGDRRGGDVCQTWFSTTIAPIIHSGEDYLRYTSTMPIWDELHEALENLDTVNGQAYDKLEEQRKVNQWRVDKQLHRTYTVTRELQKKLGDAYRKSIYGLTKQANASAAKLPVTSYVIHVHSARGGVMYTNKDSMQSRAVEVCFPLSAARMLYDHISGVDLVKSHGHEFETVGHVGGEEHDLTQLQRNVKLPVMRKATAQAALNVFERLKPKLSDWINVW